VVIFQVYVGGIAFGPRECHPPISAGNDRIAAPVAPGKYRLTVPVADQNFPQALAHRDRGYVIVHGKIAFEGKSAEGPNNNDLIRKFCLGL
jgi:branched-chain amino acid transport system ATP-binding protein